MQANFLPPATIEVQASVTKAATYTAASVKLPVGESYEFILDVTAASGTSETLDVALQKQAANGTWYTFARFAQVTTAAIIRRLQLQPSLGRGEAGSEGALAVTGGALNANTIIPRDIRVLATIGGTNPSYTFTVQAFVVPKAAGSY